MVDTTIRALGPTIRVSSEHDEEELPALGDGVAKPGSLVSIGSDSKVVGTDVGAAENFTGIVKEHPILGTDVAITSGVKCTVIVPKSGRRYRIRVLDQGGGWEIGHPVTFSATPGAATDGATAILGKIGTASKRLVDDDTVMEIRWA